MRNKEVIEVLRELGFVMVRDGSKHQIWQKGTERVIMPHGTGSPWWARNRLRTLIRRHAS